MKGYLKLISIFVVVIIMTTLLFGCKKAEIKIEVESDSIAIFRTEEFNLQYDVKNSESAVEITSSNPNIVKVDGNKIIALEVGSSNITITLKDNPEITQTIRVRVKEVEINLNLKDEKLFVGKSNKLQYTFNPSNYSENITFSSDNNNVAIIDSEGNITPKKMGEVTFSARTNSGIENTITVTVENPTEFEFSLECDANITYGLNKTYPISVSSEYTALVDLGFNYSSSDEGVATISSTGLLTVLKPGDVVITAKSKLSDNFSATISISIKLDPIALFESYNIEHPFVREVTSYGDSEKVQTVYGSVSLYSNMDINLIEKIIPLSSEKYAGQTATEELLQTAESEKLVRSGILHTSTSKITYHDTGNNNPTADALVHANYMVGAANLGSRARSWHYTVDEGCIIHHIPDDEVTWQGDTFGSYSTSIGVETCVNYGADLEMVWHRTAKLMASLLIKHDLEYSDIVQHYDWNKKECPQTLRRNNLYPYAFDMIKAEYEVMTLLEGYNVEFISLNEELVNNVGRVIKLPDTPTTVGYIVHITGDNYDQSKVLYTTIESVDGTTEDFRDLTKVKAFNDMLLNVTKDNIEDTKNEYYELNDDEKAISGIKYLYKLIDGLATSVNKPELAIEELYAGNASQRTYIELKNTTDHAIQLADYNLKYNGANASDVKTFAFSEKEVRAGASVIVACQENEGSFYYVYGDFVAPFTLEHNGKLVVSKGSNIIDTLEYTNTKGSGLYIPEDSNISITRLGYSENMAMNYMGLTPDPKNYSNEGFFDSETVNVKLLSIDMKILSIPTNVTLADKDLVMSVYNEYNELSAKEKTTLRFSSILKEKKMTIDSLENPDLAVINAAIADIPEQIIDDYKLPEFEGLTYSYVEGEDTSCYDIATGTLLKTTYDYKPIKLQAEYNSSKAEFTINFGLINEGQQIIFSTGAKAPTNGTTAEGYGTYETQESTAGFGGYMIVVGDKVFFIGEKSYIELDYDHETLTRDELRPYGTTSDTSAPNNQGLVKGVPTSYRGSGALYYNATDHDYTFDPTDTYGRANAITYGYSKIAFAPNDDGTYTFRASTPNSGDNTSTSGTTFSLKAHEFLWAPHTFETNLKGGTALTTSGDGTLCVVGILEEGMIVKIIPYKVVTE